MTQPTIELGLVPDCPDQAHTARLALSRGPWLEAPTMVLDRSIALKVLLVEDQPDDELLLLERRCIATAKIVQCHDLTANLRQLASHRVPDPTSVTCR